MADIDSALATSLKQAKTKPMFFAFVAKGTEGKLLVDKKKISPKTAAEAKKECGGGTIYQGRCTGEEGKMVFEVGKEVPPTLSALTKKIIKQNAGLMLDVEYRVAPDVEAEENETESEEAGNPSAAAPPPPAPPAAVPEANKAALEFATRLKALQPLLQKVEAVNKVLTTQAKAQIAEGNKAFLAKQYEAANADLDRAEAMLQHGLTGTVKEAGTAPPSAGGEVMKRLNAMTADIKAALAGPEKARVQSLFVAVNGFIKNKDFVQANKTLDELAPLTKQVPIATPPPSAADDAALSAEWERRVTELEPAVLKAQKTRAGEAKWMTMFMTAQDLGGEGEFSKSLTILDKLEGLLNAAPQGVSGEAPADSNVVFTQSRLRWDATRKEIKAELQTTERKILEHCEKVNADPQSDEEFDLPATTSQIKQLYTLLDKLDVRLINKLDEALNAADPQQRKTHKQDAKKIIEEYNGVVSTDPMLAALTTSKVAPSKLKDTLVGVLNDLSSKL